MRMFLILVFLFMAVPARAGGDSFDPDQPFREALNSRLLESLLNQAKEAIEDHFEISGDLESDTNGTEPKRSLRFKFFPEGKSKSPQHFSAEGWIGPSPDSQQQEMHLRFALPKPSRSSPPLPDNVL